MNQPKKRDIFRWFRKKKKIQYGFHSFEIQKYPTVQELTGPVSTGFMDNFAMIIPAGPFKEPSKRNPSRWKRFLCFIGLHDWINPGISYYGPKHPRKCTRCDKFKFID